MNLKNKNLNYQLGIMTGEYIISHDLPTLSTDGIKTHRCIEVSDEDKKLHDQVDTELHKSYTWSDTYDKNLDSKILFQNFKNLNDQLGNKYLPHTLVCRVPKIYPTDMNQFMEGIRESLWESDCCSYNLDTNQIKFEQTIGWCSKITLKLDI